MKIAILLCDHIPDEIQDHLGGDYDTVFTSLYQAYFPSAEITTFDATIKQLPQSVMEFDVYVITGSQYSVYDDLDWLDQLNEFLKQMEINNRTCIGICFGHQLIAHVFGGEVLPAKNGWAVGIQTFHLTMNTNWLNTQQIEYNIIMSCQDQVIKLPEKAQIIAENHFCSIGIFQYSSNFLGIQGHPEWTKAYSKVTMERRRSRIGEIAFQNGIQSLELEPSQSYIMNLIKDFIVSRN